MNKKNPVEDLQEIRKMMESSSKFLSLSGLSGVFAGVTALVGTWLAWTAISHFEKTYMLNYMAGAARDAENDLVMVLALTAAGILGVALGGGFLFTWLKARRQGMRLSTPVSFRLLRSLMVPLLFGGCFVLIEAKHGYYELIMPSTLIFYGMALLNASKYVHVDIKYLAVSEMILALISFWMLDFSEPMQENINRMFFFWAFGFGVLHILYGAIMYFRYDYKKN